MSCRSVPCRAMGPFALLRAGLFACAMLVSTVSASGQNPSQTEPENALPLPALVERCSPAVVMIQVENASGQSQGSGVILDPSGKVLTCNHVIAGAKSAVVKMSNGAYFPAEGVLGGNPSADLALLRLKAQGLPSVGIGDYTELAPGEAVFAISSPVGVENTVSEGIVSGLRRIADLPEPYKSGLRELGFGEDQTVIQFTAPIYFGSSGGPLFNMRGEVVGIVSLRFQADNMYFAFPAKLAEAHLASETMIPFSAAGMGLGAPNPKLGDLPESVGLLPAKQTAVHIKAPRGGDLSVRLLEGMFVNPETVTARCTETNEQLTRVTHMPQPGEFRAVQGGVLYFAEADAGKQLTVQYEYNIQRVAVLPCVNASDFPELPEMTWNAVAEELKRRGFEVIPLAEVDAAARDASINVSGTAFGKSDAVSPESIRQVASDTNAALVVYVAVGTGEGLFTGGAMAVPVQGTGVFLALFDGHTGKDLFTKAYSEEKMVMFGGRRRGRENCVRNAPRRLLDEYLGPHSD